MSNDLDDLLDCDYPKENNRWLDVLKGMDIIIYGAGDGLITFSMFVLSKYSLNVDLILDKKFSVPTLLNGIDARSPVGFIPDRQMLDESVVVITVGKRKYYNEINSDLRDLGFKNVVHVFDIYEYHLSHAPKEFGDVQGAFFKQHRDKIKNAYSLLCDDYSREVFVDVLRTYVTRVPHKVRCEKLYDQYFPDDIVLKKGGSRVINCGSYDGDTVRQLNRRYGKIDSLCCFEPDLNNYKKLTEYLLNNSGLIADSLMAFPCGVWSDDVQLKFSAGQRINSSISEDGDVMIQCVSLDHVMPEFNPTYINMDIEGAELEALCGARKMIKEGRPDLAVCVYHKPEDLWEIPLYVRSIVPEYSIFIRNYTGYPAETVMYASV